MITINCTYVYRCTKYEYRPYLVCVNPIRKNIIFHTAYTKTHTVCCKPNISLKVDSYVVTIPIQSEFDKMKNLAKVELIVSLVSSCSQI